jgi:hypothetical protein
LRLFAIKNYSHFGSVGKYAIWTMHALKPRGVGADHTGLRFTLGSRRLAEGARDQAIKS